MVKTTKLNVEIIYVSTIKNGYIWTAYRKYTTEKKSKKEHTYLLEYV